MADTSLLRHQLRAARSELTRDLAPFKQKIQHVLTLIDGPTPELALPQIASLLVEAQQLPAQSKTHTLKILIDALAPKDY